MQREAAILSLLPRVAELAGIQASKVSNSVTDLGSLREELRGVGVIGAIQAVDRFSDERGTSLKTYASYCIRGAMLDYLTGLDPLPRSCRRRLRALEKNPTDNGLMDLVPAFKRSWWRRVLPAERWQAVRLESLGADELADGAATPEVVCYRKERSQMVRRAIQTLPQNWALVLFLRYYWGASRAEVAAMLGCSVNRVSQIDYQARHRLRPLLETEAVNGTS